MGRVIELLRVSRELFDVVNDAQKFWCDARGDAAGDAAGDAIDDAVGDAIDDVKEIPGFVQKWRDGFQRVLSLVSDLHDRVECADAIDEQWGSEFGRLWGCLGDLLRNHPAVPSSVVGHVKCVFDSDVDPKKLSVGVAVFVALTGNGVRECDISAIGTSLLKFVRSSGSKSSV